MSRAIRSMFGSFLIGAAVVAASLVTCHAVSRAVGLDHTCVFESKARAFFGCKRGVAP